MMKKVIPLLLVGLLLSACNKKKESVNAVKETNDRINIIGTWKMVYGEIKESDSVTVKDLSGTDFIKIINEDHFAFFNQPQGTSNGFYGGGGSYNLKGNHYEEILNYVAVDELRGHIFPFKIEVVGDTLIQYGKEEVKAAGINRDIIEKYIRIK